MTISSEQGASGTDLTYGEDDEAFRAELLAWLEQSLPAAWRSAGYWAGQPAQESFERRRIWEASKAAAGFSGVDWPQEFGGREVFFTDSRVPADAVLGTPGEGWKVAMLLPSFERGSSAMGQYTSRSRCHDHPDRHPGRYDPDSDPDPGRRRRGATARRAGRGGG